MMLTSILLFFIFLLVSAFFSASETSLLSLNPYTLDLMEQKGSRRARMTKRLLARIEQLLATILIGNNLVNVAAAAIATYLFTQFLKSSQSAQLFGATIVTTLVLLAFGEVTPKSYGYRHAEKLSYLYILPIRFFNLLFFPLVKGLALLVNSLFNRSQKKSWAKKELSLEEIKHFLANETQLFKHNPETLTMLIEIIDISQKDIKAIMTPRTGIAALKESSGSRELKKLILEKKFSKIPIYKGSLDHISGIIDAHALLPVMLNEDFKNLDLKKIAVKPIFVSEYSSLNYILKEFKRQRLNLAVVLDEYGSTIGIITLSDILSGILGDIALGSRNITKLNRNVFQCKGSTPVAEINSRLGIDLPEKKDYTTISGLFIYYFGKMPQENARVKIKQNLLIAKKMGKRKIEDILLIRHEDPSAQ